MDENSTPPPAVARVLIVDDHPNTASMLARVLKKLETPSEVLTANSGEEALQLIGEKNVDVLITDFIMPGMSGLELIEKLKREDREPGHVILMTAYDIPGLVMTTRQLKVQDYLVKPVDPEKIRGIVDKVLRQMYPAQALEEAAAEEAPPRILIADDNPDNIRLLAVRLQSEGYEFITAADGVETLEKVAAEKPDLVLLDVNMPRKDGFEVLTEMRANSEMAHLPVIIITAARIGIKDVREGLTLGADDYITKPFDWRELSARIRTKLRVKRAEDALRQRSKNLSVLPEISLDLGERLDIEGLTKSILARTVGALEAQNGYLFVFQANGQVTFQAHQIQVQSSWTLEETRGRFIVEGVVAQVISSRQGVIIENTTAHAEWPGSAAEAEQSAIVAPMLGRRDVLGVMVLVHQSVGYFKPEHLTLVQAIASQAALAVENAQLYASERKRVNELVALNQLIRDINRFTRSTELVERLPQMLRDVFGYPAVALWLVENGNLILRTLVGAENAPRPSILELAPQQAALTGQPAQVSGAIEERSGERALGGQPPVQSSIAVPLSWNSKVRGVISMHSQKAGAFQESDRVVLETLAAQVTSAFERIQLFESVEQEQRRLAAVLRSAADAILVLDGEGRVQLSNPAAERLFTDVSVRVGQELPCGRGYDDLIEMLDATRRGAEAQAHEIYWPDKRTFSVQITPVEDGGQVAILHDVSHFKALDQIKNEFLATATHDLKNPIFAVLGYSDLLVKAGALTPMQIDFVSRIRNASVQMQDLVLNLLEVARMDMGSELKLETFDLNEVLQSAVDEFKPQAELRQHELSAQLADAPLPVEGDRTRLMQVARNLLGNALKYTPNGGKVTVRSDAANGKANAYFADTGIGISEDDLAHLFEKFYRVRSDATQDIEGNGLGLAIVQAIVEQHQGQVQVQSKVGEGSCFSFHLPLM
jgi:signal transduction histidine kinase/DNA-binding NarL/FixJ family response regulator